MGFGRSDRHIPQTIKILVAGGFGSGKTTLVGSISELRPLRTEEVLIDALTDTGAESPDKTTTTVAMDFGRITINDDIVVYLFGTPGQDRFWFMWDELSLGALGAVVLADTSQLTDCFTSVDYFARRGTPFLVAVNCFDGGRRYGTEAVRSALDLDESVPVLLCDVRNRGSVKDVLIALVEHVLDRSRLLDHN